MAQHYILGDECNPVAVEFDEWVQWFGTADRQIAVTQVDVEGCQAIVSTQFIGVDPRPEIPGLTWEGAALLFETLVIGGPLHSCVVKYATVDDAGRGHVVVVDRVDKAIKEAIDNAR
jgi:hypothetical protein